ncbi:GxGYxYP domain-containing protein [Dictyobacter arantiisoli]|uniref:GxGYxYP putative glycoside hydrolase N-terminal domain-containing protein n=1 Tax=Dictyobacter arantiisoli TaxID=2014874 RepID=A0A5A5TGC6_9CHLR|nr:GxGYxYP domain-containing protein [Dictyobacter arantiisoli]GCF10631.1 hypothetical protein KDI_41950 [Dictyobacter arantiisoli]
MSKTVARPWLTRASLILCLGIIGMALLGWRTTVIANVHVPASPQIRASSGIFWPASQALPTFAQPQALDVAQLNNVPGDIDLLFSTLEGVVNRSQPRIYLVENQPREGATTWLQTLAVPATFHTDPWDIVSKYTHEVRGMIVYDPRVADSINVATTLAGLEGGVVASPRLIQRLKDQYHLPLLNDLRGKFANNLAANIWQIHNLWPRTTHRLLIGLSPMSLDNRASEGYGPSGYLRDYAVANRALVCWLPIMQPATALLFRQLLASVRPGTPYLGWFDSESRGVRMASAYGVYTLAADFFSNMTVFSGVRTALPGVQTLSAPALKKKIYVTITVSEGDNLQYDQHAMRVLWNSPGRGSVPLNWTVSPLLADVAPAILSYYEQTATRNDLLISGPSGAGYYYPSEWPIGNLNSFLRQSNTYLARTGLHVIFYLNDNQNLPRAVTQLRSARTQGILLNWFYARTTTRIGAGQVPVSTQITGESRVGLLRAIRNNAAGWNGKAPLFIAALAVAWKLTPADIAYVVEHLGPNFVVVRGDQYFQLIRRAYHLPAA